MSKPRNTFERRGWGWGWKDSPILTQSVSDLRHIGVCGGIKSREHRHQFRRAVAILGQYAHDNACDVEGMPMYTGRIGELRKLVAMIDDMESRRTDR